MKLKIHRGYKDRGVSCIEITSNLGTNIFINIGSENFNTVVKVPVKIKEADAIFFSQIQPDHTNLLNDVSEKIPIYAGKISKNILEVLMLLSSYGSQISKHSLHYFNNCDEIQIKDISVIPFLLNNNSIDSYAFLIRADGKTILCLGDHDLGTLENYDEGMFKSIDVVLANCTYMPYMNSGSGIATLETIKKIIRISENPSFINLLVLDIGGVIAFLKSAIEFKKIFVCDIFTALVLWIARKKGLEVPQMTSENMKILYSNNITDRKRCELRLVLNEIDCQDFVDFLNKAHIAIDDINFSSNEYVFRIFNAWQILGKLDVKRYSSISSKDYYNATEVYNTKNIKGCLKDRVCLAYAIQMKSSDERKNFIKFLEITSPKCFMPIHVNKPNFFLDKNMRTLKDIRKKMPEMNIISNLHEIDIG